MGPGVWSLIGELRSQKSRAAAKKKKKNKSDLSEPRGLQLVLMTTMDGGRTVDAAYQGTGKRE